MFHDGRGIKTLLTNIYYTRHKTTMVIFGAFVGWNIGHNMPYRKSDPEADKEQVPIEGNAQFVAEGNGNCVIVKVEDSLENNIFGEWH